MEMGGCVDCETDYILCVLAVKLNAGANASHANVHGLSCDVRTCASAKMLSE